MPRELTRDAAEAEKARLAWSGAMPLELHAEVHRTYRSGGISFVSTGDCASA